MSNMDIIIISPYLIYKLPFYNDTQKNIRMSEQQKKVSSIDDRIVKYEQQSQQSSMNHLNQLSGRELVMDDHEGDQFESNGVPDSHSSGTKQFIQIHNGIENSSNHNSTNTPRYSHKSYKQDLNKSRPDGLKVWLMMFCIVLVIMCIIFAIVFKYSPGPPSRPLNLPPRPYTTQSQSQPPSPQVHPSLNTYVVNFTYIRQDQLQKQIRIPTNKPSKLYGLDTRMQIGTEFDHRLKTYAGNIDFGAMRNRVLGDLDYEVTWFGGSRASKRMDQANKLKEAQQDLLHIKNLVNDTILDQYLQNLAKLNKQNAGIIQQDTMYNLALQLIRNTSKSKLSLEAQYLLAQNKYHISELTPANQVSICILTTQRNVISNPNNLHIRYFDSLQQQNYTNFKVVYVDDCSTDNSSSYLFQYINKNLTDHLKNKIIYVRNKKHYGSLVNLYFYGIQFCEDQDIVVVIDGDDRVIGTQGFKILSKVYESKRAWYVYSSYLIQNPQNGYLTKGTQSTYLQYKTSQYRISFEWLTSHMRTFRKSLLSSIPFQSLLQFQYNSSSKTATPSFYRSAADIILTFPMLQLSGNYHITHIDQYLYDYSFFTKGQRPCYRTIQQYEDVRYRLRTPLRQIVNLQGTSDIKQVEKWNIGISKFAFVQNVYKAYKDCFDMNGIKY